MVRLGNVTFIVNPALVCMQLRHRKKRERGRRESEREEGGRVRERECTIPRVFSSPGREEGRDGVTSSIPMATSDLTSFTNLSAISLYVPITHVPITMNVVYLCIIIRRCNYAI